MKKEIYHFDLDQKSEAWQQKRTGIITASRMKDIITPQKKDDKRVIVYEKILERLTGEVKEIPINDDMERGTACEPIVRNIYSEKETLVKECGFITLKIEDGIIGYSPDGLVGDDGLIEIKCPRLQKHIKIIIEDDVPKEYLVQLQTGLLVSGRKWCDFISYFEGYPLFIKRVFADQEYQDKILIAAQKFNTALEFKMRDYEEKIKNLHKTEIAFSEI